MARTLLLTATILLAAAARLTAQEQWGVNLGVTPTWQTGPGVNALFGADQVDVHGSEFRIGFVRGLDIEGDWGLSLVRTNIAAGSTVDADVAPCSRGTCGTYLRANDPIHMTGLEFHQFYPFKTWRERVQLGMVGAVGLGWLKGNVSKRVITDQSDTEATVDAGEFYPPSKSVVPLVHVELAVAGVIVPGFKIRASGGWGMPGYHTFGINFIYMVPQH
jgi:hypothetical protein